MGWHKGNMVAFDLESTGVSTENDRIVTGCVALINGTTGETNIVTLLANPGVDIPEQATAVHGITTAHAVEHGQDAAKVVAALANTLMIQVFEGVPIVGCNLQYDFTLLDRETRRHGLHPFGDRFTTANGVAIDAYVLDKATDRYRPGSRKLTDLCTHYKVRIDGAHDASHDAIAAARVVYRIAQRNPQIAAMPLHELHAFQVKAKADQSQSFRDYKATRGESTEGIRDEWPLVPADVVEGVIV
jgi:DNA polymerase-3 subunit epsilon